MSAAIQIEGLDEAIDKLKRLDKLERLKPYIKAAGAQVKSAIAVYPPASEANSPSNPTGRWYQRGFGPKWMTKKGLHSRKTSETLGRRWTNESSNGGLSAVIGNNVSYGPFVHDPDKQVSFHKTRGWKTTEQVADEQTDEVTRIVMAGIEKILGAGS